MENNNYDPVYGYETDDTGSDNANNNAAGTEVKAATNTTSYTTGGLPEDYDIKKGKRTSFRRGILVGVCSCLGVVIVAAGIISLVAMLKSGGNIFTKDVESKVAFIEALIKETYYRDVDQETMTEGIYSGIVSSLGDPYSGYYTADQYSQLMIDVSGEYGGIGASLLKDPDTGEVMIIKIYDGFPAKKAGLKEGDVIISADGQMGDEMDLEIFVKYIRGEPGSVVEIKYRRDGEENVVSVTRENIIIPTVAHRMLKDNIGYIEISEFSNSTAKDFNEAMNDLDSQGVEGIIIDLRSNPGGVVDTAVDIADALLPKGLVVYLQDKQGHRTNYNSDASWVDTPLVVLVDGNSASSSEILVGALRDYDRATIVGTKTYGKGIVQSTLPLGDGSAVKLTIAEYFTPNGDSIDGVGIEPDVVVEYEYSGDEDAEEYDYLADSQVQKALEILKGQ